VEIRSYRRVFDLERRIYRIDRLRLNPSGVPLRGVVYFLASLAFAVLSARLPLARAIAGPLPWYARDIALPGALAALLAIVRIDGRPFHLAAGAVIRSRARRRRLVCVRPAADPRSTRWTPPPVVMIPDGSDARIRRFRYTGPGVVRVAVAHERAVARLMRGGVIRRAALVVREAEASAPERAGAEVIVLARGAVARLR
jgi:hypothetical protein